LLSIREKFPVLEHITLVGKKWIIYKTLS
jgi:hypothetical protein